MVRVHPIHGVPQHDQNLCGRIAIVDLLRRPLRLEIPDGGVTEVTLVVSLPKEVEVLIP